MDTLKLVGEHVGEYQLLRFVGAGAAGCVYEAVKGGERFAVKVYKDWLFERASTVQESRISREALTNEVTHRNLCRVYEAVQATIRDVE